MKEETKPAADPAADLALAACLSFKDRRKQWFAAFDKLLWDEYNAPESVETACRDAKALGFSQSTIMKDSGKEGGIALLGFIVGKYEPVCASLSEALKEVYRVANEVGLPDRVLMFTQEVPDLYYDHQRHTFWYKTAIGCYQNITKETALEMLNEAGLSVKKEENGSPSEAHRRLLEVIRTKGVDWAGVLAGYPAGPYAVKGRELLVTSGFKLIEPKPGDSRLVSALIDGLLGEDAIHLHLHLKASYEALCAGRKDGSLATIIVGPPDCGKSLLLEGVIVKVLGGRKANAYGYLAHGTTFNDELIGSEIHAIDDGNPFDDADARHQFGNSIKQMVAGHEIWCHPKGRAGFTLPIYRRLFILTNKEDLHLMPELDDSLEDKILLLKAQHFAMPKGLLPLPAANVPWEREKFTEALEAELPAYIGGLLCMETNSKDFESRRFGVVAYQNSDLLDVLEEVSGLAEKHALIQKTVFKSSSYRGLGEVELELSELYEALMEGDYKDRAGKVFRSLRGLGTSMGLLAKKKSASYIGRRSNGASFWKIKRDPKYDEVRGRSPE